MSKVGRVTLWEVWGWGWRLWTVYERQTWRWKLMGGRALKISQMWWCYRRREYIRSYIPDQFWKE